MHRNRPQERPAAQGGQHLAAVHDPAELPEQECHAEPRRQGCQQHAGRQEHTVRPGRFRGNKRRVDDAEIDRFRFRLDTAGHLGLVASRQQFLVVLLENCLVPRERLVPLFDGGDLVHLRLQILVALLIGGYAGIERSHVAFRLGNGYAQLLPEGIGGLPKIVANTHGLLLGGALFLEIGDHTLR